MKKICIIFLLSIIISLTAFGFVGGNPSSPSAAATGAYLRIHIRADSNESQAQAVKYVVRDAVVEYLTPIVAECETKEESVKNMKEHLREMEQVANEILLQKGFSYGAEAEVAQEYFPTRVYEDCTLPAGEYTALILKLGRGEGDNWWCVVYPPLCFAAKSNQNVIYKSKIKEIIEDWKNSR